MALEIRHQYVQLNGIRLHYAACGHADAPLLLFVHGFPESWMSWRAQLEAFGDHFHAVAVDTRGIGESTGPAAVDGYRARHMVTDLVALLDHLGVEKCVIVGHDWGGAIACALAFSHPERLHGLVMINAVHPDIYRRELVQNPAQQAASAYMTFFLEDDAEARVCADDHHYLIGMLASGTASLPDWLDDDLLAACRRTWSRPGSVRAGLAYYRASPLHPASRMDPGASGVKFDRAAMVVPVPTLIIWGEQDVFLLPGCLEGLGDYFPDRRVERIADASHWVVHEKGLKVNRLITEFLNERIDRL
ncbi:alpha/beta fold hydrolase [Cupriavidus oxalaticus]|uniref:Alpha/beta hydrolase n=1 Tax=Cupriavidus oxalaticus TaxID=96344 RepID=A0A375FLK5_9BURK|nr:alpha/beta hydrolase [Cupriavidus oxalaticus]QRQ85846.1 alpha/beta hydrolase [Cupriavidus oxalaticus]QRQ95828.1 alpha/beta hydrolase [Cupriavidus oxalaticus]WQD84505.1 alpha/beta hydrolase [Cupriavidus oxalaticus]SPC06577.1 Peptidase S33 family [Cupriavidus oxalaticus]SPC12442.1 Peptidase S33 family [Cupriavidus oxalaticus]